MRKAALLLGCFFSTYLFPYSLWLINDTPFELNVIVHTATGNFLGQDTLKPGEQKLWSSEHTQTVVRETDDSTASATPFSVTWQCSYEGFFSVNNDVGPGQAVKASQGTGTKSCKKKPEKEEDKCPPCPSIEMKETQESIPPAK